MQKTYSADELAALSKMSTGMIRELAQLSLLDERDGHFGFRDLAGARQIAKLLDSGVRLSEIIRAVSEIRKVPPRDIAYYRSAHQCEHAHAASVRRWPELKYTCLPLYR